MIELKATADVENRVHKILSDNEKEVLALNETIAADAEAMTSATRAMDAATAAGNEKGYKAAKDAYQKAAETYEIHSKRLNHLQNNPVVSAEDYESMTASIKAEFDVLNGQTLEKLADLTEQMEAAADELLEAQERANNVLKLLQHDLYKDADRMRSSATGKIIFTVLENKAIDCSDAILWGRSAATNAMYEQYSEKYRRP